jgi:hypothetical protein
MMEWEGQFRGGKGIHSFDRGGINFAGRRQENNPPRSTNVQIKPKPLDRSRIMDAIRIQETGGEADPNRAISYNKRGDPVAYGPFQIRPGTAADAGFGVSKWPTFLQEFNAQGPDFSNKSRAWAREYLDAMFEKFGDEKRAISAYMWGPGNVSKVGNPHSDFWNLDYYNSVMGHYNRGGIARRPNAVPPTEGPDPYGTFINDSVAQIRSSPSEFMGSQFIQKFNKGGFVKKNAPKVLGKLTNYKPKLTMSDILKNMQKAKAKKAQPSSKPWAVFDRQGNPVKDFRVKKEADEWLKGEKDVEGSDEYYETIIDYKVGKKKIIEEAVEQPGAMFWGSREKIIGAPTEAMTARQWLQYLQLPKHGILNPKGYPIIKHAELNDTSLSPWLSRMGNKTISKNALVKQFDEMAPTMDVTVLGESTGGRIFDDMSRKLAQVDTQAIRNPAIKGFYDYIKAVLPQLKQVQTGKAADEIAAHIDDMVFRNFGVENALEAGVPQRFPFEIKELLQSISTGLGKRTAGFKTYKRSPQHRGTQTMDGGDNYREFLFKYKPGSLRQKEPSYEYAHSFNLSSKDRAGGIVHTRTSDRADQFGRRLLHIEEIQSDMHQKINMAQRQLKKMHTDWAKEGKTPEGEYKKMTKDQRKEYDNLVRDGRYAPRGDLQEEISTANEQHLLLVKAKIEDLLAQKQTASIKTRINRLNKERIKLRYIIDAEKKKMAQGNHSGVPLGPLSKTEDYNEFIMKYMLRVAREGGYDGITINTPAIKNLGMSSTGRDYKGNLVAYGPMAQGAMKKAAKKSGAKFMKTVIVDSGNRVWEVPMILFKENKAAQALIDKGLPIYKKGGIVKK